MVIYQESLHDARSTKYKIYFFLIPLSDVSLLLGRTGIPTDVNECPNTKTQLAVQISARYAALRSWHWLLFTAVINLFSQCHIFFSCALLQTYALS